MNPYRDVLPIPRAPLEVERPWFPHVGELVRILRRREPFLVKDVGRVGVVKIILGDVYSVAFECCCIACGGRGECGRRLCHAVGGLFVLSELGDVAFEGGLPILRHAPRP